MFNEEYRLIDDEEYEEDVLEEEQEIVYAKEIDHSYRYLIAQIFICGFAVLIALALKGIGGNLYKYAKDIYSYTYNQSIDMDQVLSASMAQQVIAAQSTQYGVGGESDDDGSNVIQQKDEISKSVSEKINASDINSMHPPVKGKVTCEFGWRTHPITKKWSFHTGIDIGANTGKEVYAVINGTVKTVEKDNYAYGQMVVLNHSEGVDTMYAHCSKILVKQGQSVKKGDVIALVGTTGLSTGPHLHFGIKVADKWVNPRWFVEL